MEKRASLFTPFTLRVIGAIIGSIGFLLVAYQKQILGTSLIGIGSILISAGEK